VRKGIEFSFNRELIGGEDMIRGFKKLNGRQGGFTLVELLVVIAILGILAAIVVPSVSKYIGGGTIATQQAEKAIIQNAVHAAMTQAKVATIPGSVLQVVGGKGVDGAGSDLDVADGTAHSDPPDPTCVGSYITGGVDKLQGTYTFNADGAITGATY
jgi:prepilin-type N-terminal cleavage/methylation domain-containing protein